MFSTQALRIQEALDGLLRRLLELVLHQFDVVHLGVDREGFVDVVVDACVEILQQRNCGEIIIFRFVGSFLTLFKATCNIFS